MSFWTGKRVLCTGSSGFIGKHLVWKLNLEKDCHLFLPTHSDFDLRDPAQVERMMRLYQPIDVVIHLAARVGGIGANMVAPANMFYDNATMGINMIHQSSKARVGKLVFISTVCSYPEFAHIPFDERAIWNGYPEPTNAAYGIAKRAMHTMLDAYRYQYGLNGICLVPTNCYGVGQGFDLETSHTIPAIIRKCVEAKESGASFFEAWGTGGASRDFIYVSDLVDAIILAAEKYDKEEPMNLGSGEETIIFSLAHTIKNMIGFKGEIKWNQSKPNGQPRRCLDIDRAKFYLGWKPRVSLEEGLRRTIDSYYVYRQEQK